MSFLESVTGAPLATGLSIAAIGLIGVFWVLARSRAARAARIAATALLALAAVLAVGNYTDFGSWRKGSYLNAWEFFHYYLGSKYSGELGYTRLYDAALTVDRERGRKFVHFSGEIRDLATGGYRSVADVGAERAAVKRAFSPERWREFSQDVRWLRRQLDRMRWNAILRDKGYNATPVWNAVVGGLLTSRISTRSESGMLLLALLDPLLLTAGAGAVLWAFGPRAALLAVVLVGTHYMMSWWHMKGALLRTDYAMSALVAVCMVRKGHYRVAGALLAYSALSRVFPAVLVFGLGAKALWELLLSRRLPRRYLDFAVSFAFTAALLIGVSVAYAGGLDSWLAFAEKIGAHNETVSHWRVGFQQIFMGSFADGALRLRSTQYADHRVLWWLIQAAVLAASFFAVRNLSDHEAFAVGFVPMFFLASPTYYYFVILLVPLLFFASRLERSSRALGLAWMFVTGAAGYAFYDRWTQEFPTYYWLSWMVLGTCAALLATALAESRLFPGLGAVDAAFPEASTHSTRSTPGRAASETYAGSGAAVVCGVGHVSARGCEAGDVVENRAHLLVGEGLDLRPHLGVGVAASAVPDPPELALEVGVVLRLDAGDVALCVTLAPGPVTVGAVVTVDLLPELEIVPGTLPRVAAHLLRSDVAGHVRDRLGAPDPGRVGKRVHRGIVPVARADVCELLDHHPAMLTRQLRHRAVGKPRTLRLVTGRTGLVDARAVREVGCQRERLLDLADRVRLRREGRQARALRAGERARDRRQAWQGTREGALEVDRELVKGEVQGRALGRVGAGAQAAAQALAPAEAEQCLARVAIPDLHHERDRPEGVDHVGLRAPPTRHFEQVEVEQRQVDQGHAGPALLDLGAAGLGDGLARDLGEAPLHLFDLASVEDASPPLERENGLAQNEFAVGPERVTGLDEERAERDGLDLVQAVGRHDGLGPRLDPRLGQHGAAQKQG